MLKIRLKKLGRKRLPFYRIIAIESSKRRNGAAVEELGFYDPINNTWKTKVPNVIKRIQDGAQPTNTVKNLLIKADIIKKV